MALQTMAVARYWLQQTHTTQLLEAVFSVQSVPRLYNEDQVPLEESLETAMV
jgi:hypothetical protein